MTRTSRFVPAVVAGVLALAGCGSSQDAVGTAPMDSMPGPSGSAPLTTEPRTELLLELVTEQQGPAEQFTLTCDPAGGSHPDPAQACADLAREKQPFAPLTGGSCTEIYGGPATAVVSGIYRDQKVTLRLARTNGCEIAQWDRLGAFLPPVAGAQ